ncbi:RING-H2 finger protein ATL3-like [Ipomoea triloba]|uniref:RING-H2 finger protein ATL3-like n=1 Tax=Ipomoea triloba TaxID=35885 RepID=UPI00125E139F|nr:RING-H2 finger protein ATL3-like [Ipomoea triloba]XP_031105890.1 RING-H2 finger protein ATL3-like [Ipomoea triloba]
MGDASHISGKLADDSSVVELTGKIMVAAIICLFLVVIIVFFLHLYAKWFWYRRSESNGGTTRRRRRFDFAAGYQEVTAAAALRRGLDPSVLKTIPVVEVSPKEFKDGLECAVCLCEVSEGEKARLLPKCNHGFHVECIDMWFQSHSTCPLCRNPISNPTTTAESTLETILRPPPEEGSVSGETPNFPTNVLFWGDETRVSTLGTGLEEPQQGPISAQSSCPSSSSSSSAATARGAASLPEGMLVIDIPRQIVGEDDQEQKSPMTTRLRSLKRLLSREKRVSPRSPCANVDVEQGARSQS